MTRASLLTVNARVAVAYIKVEPSGLIIETAPGETVMAAALRMGARWPSVCGGHGECGACVMRVDSGADQLSPMGAAEQRRLDDVVTQTEGDFRLACQAVPAPSASIVVRRSGVRPAPPKPGAAGKS